MSVFLSESVVLLQELGGLGHTEPDWNLTSMDKEDGNEDEDEQV